MLRFCVLVVLCLSAASGHSSNWAVVVCASRDWRNYRHVANALSIYRTVKRLGIPDSHIILMLADDIACNARNAFPASVFNAKGHRVDVYGSSVESDYRGYEVTVENFIRVLTGRHDAAVPRSKRMTSDAGSNILIYLTGHGGDEFLKFQSQEDIMSKDIADAIAQMHEKQRYNEILLIVDTCQASTLYAKIHSPNVFSIGSSVKGESSYSYDTDPHIGVSLIDRFTLATLNFLEGVDIQSKATLKNLLDSYRPRQMLSTLDYNEAQFHRNKSTVLLTDFFGHVAATRAIPEHVRLTRSQSDFNTADHSKSTIHSDNKMPLEKQQTLETTYYSPLIGAIMVVFVSAALWIDQMRM